jgi:ankyrin repeat protein
MKESRILLQGAFSLSKNENTASLPSHLQALMGPIFPERHDGDLSHTIQRLFDVTNRNVLFPEFQLIMYLVSNNLWENYKLKNFLQCIVEYGHESILALSLKIEAPTVQAFTERLLECAVMFGLIQIFQLLLDLKIDNKLVSGFHGGRLLQKAAEWRQWEMVQILLERGAYLNIPVCEEYPESALCQVVRGGQTELVRTLIKAGARVDVHSYVDHHYYEECYTPLSLAVEDENAELAAILIDAGADVDSCVVCGISALCWSELNNNGEFHTILCNASTNEELQITTRSIVSIAGLGSQALSDYLNGKGLDTLSKAKTRLEDALQLAADEGKIDAVRTLLEIGVDPNAAGHNHWASPLISSLQNDWLDVVELLLDAGADANGCYANELMMVDQKGNIELLRLLVRNEADIDEALQCAAYWGNVEGVEEFLRAGADVNAPALNNELSAIAAAASSGNIEVVELLLAAGADVNPLGDFGTENTALSQAVQQESMEVVQTLLDAGADVNAMLNSTEYTSILQHAVRYRGGTNTKLIEILLKAGADVNAAPAIEGRTALQYAITDTKPNVKLVKMLLKAGADINAAPAKIGGRTALQGAVSVEKPSMELITIMLEAGADVHAPAAPTRGITALQGAAIRGHINIVLRLLEAGADVSAPAARVDGRTAIDGAAEHGRLDMVKLLLNAGAKSYSSDRRNFGRAIELAETNGHFAIARLLESA